jgi:hypothetical protein
VAQQRDRLGVAMSRLGTFEIMISKVYFCSLAADFASP